MWTFRVDFCVGISSRKMEFVLFLIVLAITYNQGAARPANSDLELITKNELASSSEFSQRISDDGFVFLIPASIKEGLEITINGTLNIDQTTFNVVLPSTSGSEDCQIKYLFQEGTIDVSPADPDFKNIHYINSSSMISNLKVIETPKFSLRLIARVKADGVEKLGILFNGNEYGESEPLMCNIKNFQDINKIVMKEGVADIHSLTFVFEHNH